MYITGVAKAAPCMSRKS